MPRGERVRSVLERYGLYGAQFQAPDIADEVPRGLIIEHGDRRYCLRHTDRRAGRVRYFLAAMRHLIQRGFPVPALHRATDGGDCVALGRGDTYYLMDWVDGEPADLESSAVLREAAALMARLHLSSVGFRPPPDSRPKELWGLWPTKLATALEELDQFRLLAQARRQRTPFDHLFLSRFEDFRSQAGAALAILKESVYDGLCRRERRSGALAHRGFNKSHLTRTSAGLVVVDLGSITGDLGVLDLAEFLERAGHNNRWQTAAAGAIISGYRRVRPLQEAELEVVAAYVRFPHRLCKLATRFYRNKKDWSVRRFTRRLQRLLDQEPARLRFVDQLSRQGRGTTA